LQNRLIVVFQPHTYSRTKKLFREFTTSFKEADILLLTRIFASKREKRDISISGRQLAQTIAQEQKNTFYFDDNQSLVSFLSQKLERGDIILTLGAGDIYKLHDKIKQIL